MSSITLGAPAAPAAPARAESRGDNGAAGFGAALADAMAPERPAAPRHGHGQRADRHSIQPKTNAVVDEAATDNGGSTTGTAESDPAMGPADSTVVSPATPGAPAPLPTGAVLVGVPVLPIASIDTDAAPAVIAPTDAAVTPALPTSAETSVTGANQSLAEADLPAPAAVPPAAAAPAAPVGSAPVAGMPATSTDTAPAARPPAVVAVPTAGTASGQLSTAPASEGAPAAESAAAITSAPAAGTGHVAGRAADSQTAPSSPAPTSAPAAAGIPAQVAAAVPGSIRAESAPKVAEPSASGAAGAVAPAPSQGVQGVASAAPVAAAQAPAPANAPTFVAQLAKPLFTLANGPAGDQIVTIKVTPENLGPVTVRAHIGADGVRMELFAPNDAGREVLRAILTDLRRDLAGQGASANLDLSSQNQPTDSGDRGARQGAPTLPDRRASAVAELETAAVRRDIASTSSLDVLA